MRNLDQIRDEEHDYRTVVIDSADWCEQLIWSAICAKRGVDSIERIDYGKGYMFAAAAFRELLIKLDQILAKKIMVVWLAHSQIVKFQDPEGESYDRYMPRLHKHVAALLLEWCDEVLFACYQVYTSSKDEGFNRRRAVATGDGERVVRTQERPAAVAKNRLNLPPEMPLDFSEYLKYFPGSKKGTK